MARGQSRADASDRPFGDQETTGYIDAIDAGRVVGWAVRPGSRYRVAVRVLIDDRPVAEDVADHYRPDLEAFGYGDGRHGFAISLPEALLDGQEHTVAVIDSTSGVRLGATSDRYRLDWASEAARGYIDQLFDPRFYAAQAGPVDAPLDHYRQTGWRQGFDPHPLFSTRHYCVHNDVREDDPLTHFAGIGQWRRAWTHPLIDPRAAAPRDGAALWDPEIRPEHPVLAYLNGRISPEEPVSRYFSDADYVVRYPGIGTSGIAPLSHYLSFGWREGLRPHRDFDPALFARLAGLDDKQEPYTHFVAWLHDRRPKPKGSAAASAPAVSVILLNHNKALLTLQCLYFLEANTERGAIEVVIVDNGSHPAEFERLTRHAGDAVLVRLDANRGFGEACNIGAEHAGANLLMFLNNDAFVCPGWLSPLRTAIEGDARVGAAGSKLLYPDGRLQEAGATISACGTAVQRGKHLDPTLPIFNRQEAVDYCSAAALMVRADAFRASLGFDLAWDPAYYEDSDLCLKLRARGLATLYVPRSEVIHLEHATSADTGLDLRLHDIVETNRLKFLARWGEWLAGAPEGAPPQLTLPEPGSSRPAADAPPDHVLALYTPYPLTPGGGERYLLTMASALRDSHRCHLLTPDRYSRLRLLTVGRELGIDLDHVQVSPLAEAGAIGPIDLFVCMANEVLPPLRGLGRTNIYHCQFPFPMDIHVYGRSWRNLATYQAVVVNSRFTANHYAGAAEVLGIAAPPVHVLAPPVPQFQGTRTRHADDVRRILSIGRFAPGGHCKRQDLMIREFERLLNRIDAPVELHLAGVIGSDSVARTHFRELVRSARNLPIRFHANASLAHVSALIARSDLYWHLTGAGQELGVSPERFEHFGIAMVEAMSAGVIPIALRGGGPSEIITDGTDGFLIDEVRQLALTSERLLTNPATVRDVEECTQNTAKAFSPRNFDQTLTEIIERYR